MLVETDRYTNVYVSSDLINDAAKCNSLVADASYQIICELLEVQTDLGMLFERVDTATATEGLGQRQTPLIEGKAVSASKLLSASVRGGVDILSSLYAEMTDGELRLSIARPPAALNNVNEVIISLNTISKTPFDIVRYKIIYSNII